MRRRGVGRKWEGIKRDGYIQEQQTAVDLQGTQNVMR